MIGVCLCSLLPITSISVRRKLAQAADPDMRGLSLVEGMPTPRGKRYGSVSGLLGISLLLEKWRVIGVKEFLKCGAEGRRCVRRRCECSSSQHNMR